jgi:hypothetical protein
LASARPGREVNAPNTRRSEEEHERDQQEKGEGEYRARPRNDTHVPGEQKGQPSSRLEASKEPSENEEKRRVVERLKEKRQDS